MLSEQTQKIFTKIFVLLILNLEFWLFSLIGLGIFGIGPALRTITEQFLTYGYDYRQYSFKELWKFYRRIFWQANSRAIPLLMLILFLFYDIYLTSQIRKAWMLPVIFMIIFVLFVTIMVSINVLLLDSNFEINLKNVFKLAFIQFFSDIRALGMCLMGLIIISSLTALWPGLLLFLTFSTAIVWANHSYRDWISKIDGKIS